MAEVLIFNKSILDIQALLSLVLSFFEPLHRLVSTPTRPFSSVSNLYIPMAENTEPNVNKYMA